MKPKSCVALLTLSCGLRCRMCHLWKNDEKNIIRPSVEQWKDFLKSISGHVHDDFCVIFGGGEPLRLPDMLVELLGYCARQGFRTSLATSAYDLTEELAKQLCDSGLNNIALTLYSTDAQIHDFLRGIKGSYRRVMEAIESLRRHKTNLEVAIDTVIMGPNMEDIVPLTDWVQQNGTIHHIFLQAVMQPFHTSPRERWYQDEEYRWIWPQDTELADSVIDQLISRKEKGYKIVNPLSQLSVFKEYFSHPDHFIKRYVCNMVQGTTFSVNPEGEINMCPFMGGIGNIKTAGFKDIWHSSAAEKRREEIARCAKNCHHIINCWYEEESR